MSGHLDPLLRELVGAVLRDERRRQARTLAQVAEAAGISMQHLSDVERGRKDPSSELLAAITGALGVSVSQLLLRAAEPALLPDTLGDYPLSLELASSPRPSRPYRSVSSPSPVARPGAAGQGGGEVALAARPGLTLLAAA
ncbi:helix-turn-helix domain-containing protein [Brachybacterium alimentarium]|uniref:helix-turn-helix domain-containing protein n=1 Tax=Brachybacterium alimentarium TaxID=47845 RepID=UPI000DF19FCB|nr:helix-turn-helix transcriptional regulator [Brachybacterium alimentarium]RCS71827.1 XRE family transcriptional regulator [Brachybacterium alimentarium]RCS79935.1 XRE family transcriptional regulator [Brachybacterium alimentarium]